MKKTCCQMRKKMTVFLGPYLTVEQCGIPDTILADFMRFDVDPVVAPDGTKKPVIAFRFCPWCGAPYTDKSETRTTLAHPVDDIEGEEWKETPE